MIAKTAIEERVREWGLREDVVEKDYVLGWVLWGIGSDPQLSQTWVFKGGTSLKKCYVETYRFSEDLDFTILPGGPHQDADLRPILTTILARIAEESGVDFSERPPLLKTHSSGNYTEGRIYYRGPRGNPSVASIKLDLSASEKVVRPSVLRVIAHPFPDELPGPATVRCYAFEEVFAEKIRAMGERSRPRDLYDIINLYRRADFQREPELIRDVLREKCESKGVPIPSYEAIADSPALAELRSEWASMLAHQLPALPPFESFWEELANLFSWLDGSVAPIVVPAFPGYADEQSAAQWSPPPTVWTWGAGIPLETIRFAGANRLCINLGYDGKHRIIEPYSLRRTRDGNLILHAIRSDSRESRSYRVDRIQSVTVTTTPFKPTYVVEFSSTAPITALSTTSAPPKTSTTRRHRSSTIQYIYACPYCQKRFRRSKPNPKLGPHKNKAGYPCPGRRGNRV